MTVNELKILLNRGENINMSVGIETLHKASDEALKILAKLNNSYHTKEEIVSIFSELIGQDVDSSFSLFPPFYTDFGKNIHIGKNVFINSNCNFQDQGGIYIGNNCLIGHRVVFATLNHDINPTLRKCVYQKPIFIEDNVWIGSGAIILPGVRIGKNSIVAAGSVVAKNVEENTIVAGVPAKFLRKIEIKEND